MAGTIWGLPELQILSVVCGDRRPPMTGYGVVTMTKLPISTVYRVLGTFEEVGYVTHQRERVDARLSDRAPRMVYAGTTVGADALNHLRTLLGAAA